LAIAVVLAAAGWTLAAMPASAQNAAATVNLNIRSCASTGCGVIYVLPAGEPVTAGPCSGSWCTIQRPGWPTGFGGASYLAPWGGGPGPGPAPGPAPAPEPDAPDVNFCFNGPQGNQLCLGTGGVSGTVNVPQQKRVCFYEEPNYAGDELCRDAPYVRNLWANPWRTNIRSVKVFGGASVVMCHDANFGGYCRTYTENRSHIHAQLRDHSYSVSIN
jgi:hypothetical protein